jgi:hypothetical protein
MYGIASNFFYNLSHFKNDSEITTYELDGHQQFHLAGLLQNRSTILSRQWQSIGIQPPAPFMTITLTLFLTKLTSVILQKGLPSNGGLILRGVKIINNTCDAILNYAGPIINTACLISYVAMIYLGHPLIGSLGIVGFALSLIKRQGYLPSLIENTLLPLDIIGFTFAAFTIETNPLFKGIGIISALCNIFAEVSKYSVVKNFLFVDDFTKKLNSTLSQEIVDSELDYSQFQINPDALHAEELKRIYPSKIPSECDLKDLYENLEKRIKANFSPDEANVSTNDERKFCQVGWDRIKNAVINDKTIDSKPFNFDSVKEILTLLLIKIQSENDQDFKDSIINLSKIGEACIAGWFKDISFLLNPQRTNIAWMIHHTLAVKREDLINHQLTLIAQHDRQFFAEAGDINNVHLNDQFHKAVWHKWRSYKGELIYQLEGRDAITRFYQRYLANEKSTDSFAYRLLSEIFYKTTLTLSLNSSFELMKFIDDRIKHYYTPEYIINMIYTDTTPDKQQFRKIEWDPIAGWLHSLSERGINILNEDSTYNEKIVKKTNYDDFRLTQHGVALLLIDLGIITYADKS